MEPTRKTQLHLDRCLTCRNCETTCPSGVQYGNLVDIGRRIVEERCSARGERAVRWRSGGAALAAVQACHEGQCRARPAARGLARQGSAHPPAGAWPWRSHARRCCCWRGCVQPSMAPNINSATWRVLDAAGIETVVARWPACCGAVKFHLNDQDGGRATRANIDAWWPTSSAARSNAWS